MPLSREDIVKIESLGFKRGEFARRLKFNGIGRIYVLKNKDKRCVFLDLTGRCKIYDSRPKGCRLYPLVYNLDEQRVELDDLCKHRNKFKVNKKDVRELLELIKEVVNVEEGSWDIGENREK